MQRFLNIRNTCVRTFPSTPRVPISRLFNSRPSSTFLNISHWLDCVKSLEKRKFHTSPWSSAERSKIPKGGLDTIKFEVSNAPHPSSKINESSSVDDVVRWAEQFVNKKHAMKLKAQEINGKALRDLDALSLERWGIPGGPASILANEIIKLKGVAQDQFDALKAPDDKYKFLISNVLPQVTVNLPPPLYNPERQKQLLGPFNNPNVQIPFAAQNIDLRLLGFGYHLTRAAQHIIQELDALQQTGSSSRYIAVCLGQSGCGKTRTIFDIASKHWVMFIECVPNREERFETTRDRNFGALVDDIVKLELESETKQFRNFGALVDDIAKLELELKKKQKEFQLKAEGRIRIEILARLLYLRGLFAIKPNLTPKDYLLGQINGGQDTIAHLIENLKTLSTENATTLVLKTYHDLFENFFGHWKLVVALDEANIALTKILPEKFVNNNGNKRGFLTALTNIIVHTVGFSPSVLYVGTALSLGVGAESIQSDIGKTNSLAKVVDFPPSEVSEIRDWFSKLLDLNGCEGVWEDPNVNWHELVGRQRLKAGVVTDISFKNKQSFESIQDPIKRKKEMFISAINNSIKLHHERMFSRLKRAVQDRTDIQNLVKEIVAGSLLSNGKISFAPTATDREQRDLVDIGICQLVSFKDDFHWKLAEPLAIRVALEVLQNLGKTQDVLDKAIKMIFDVMKQLGPKCSEKGKFAEILIAANMFQWNGKTLGDLDVVKVNIDKIPKWMFDVTFQLTKIGTAQQLGFADDLVVVSAIKHGKIKDVLLLPDNNMRPDILWLKFQGGKWYAMDVGQKIYSRNVDKDTFDNNKSSTDLSLVYHTKDGKINVKDKYEAFHRLTNEAFRNDPSKLGGILRIHVLLPSVVTSRDVKSNANGNEVCLYITKENVSSFFSFDTLQVLTQATQTKML